MQTINTRLSPWHIVAVIVLVPLLLTALDNPANMMYFGVLLVGLMGAIISRLQPKGMSNALFATAFAMMLVPLVAWAIGTPAFANGLAAVFALHSCFAWLFTGSALLFRRAAHTRQE